MKFSSLISWACTSLLEKIRWITRAPVTASERVEQRSRAPMAAGERKEQRSRATASYSEYREFISTSKEPMEHKLWEPKNRLNPEKEFEWMKLQITIKEEDIYSKYLEQIQTTRCLDNDSVLMKMMQNTIEELANSDFYSNFLKQIQSPQLLNHLSRVLGSESQFQVVIYGVFGFFSTYNVSAPIELALILLLKRDFNDRIGEIQVFDSYFNQTEVRVLEDLGFSVLRIDENAYREVLKPTLFFIPHAPHEVYDHLLRANWKPENLNQMIILGDDLSAIKRSIQEFNGFRLGHPKCQFNGYYIRIFRYLMCIPRFSTVVPISSIDGDRISKKLREIQSWHFFTRFDDDPKTKLLLKPVVVITGIFYYLFYRYRKRKLITEDEEEEEDSSWKPNYSKEFRLGWLFRRQRIRSDKHSLLKEKNRKKKRMFYVSRAIVLPWFEGLPRKKWELARKIAQGVMTWMKVNDDEISTLQLDLLMEAWF